MNKDSLLGIVLMAALLFGFMYCNRPTPEQGAEQTAGKQAEAVTAAETAPAVTADSAFVARVADKVKAYGTPADSAGGYRLATAGATLSLAADGTLTGTVKAQGADRAVQAVINSADTSLTAGMREAAVKALDSELSSLDRYQEFAPFLGGDADTLTLDNGVMKVTFSSRGGLVQKVVLNRYDSETTGEAVPVCLFSADTQSYEFEFETATQRIATGALNFAMTQPDDSTVVMSLPLRNGSELGIRYTVRPGEYLVGMDLVQKNMDAVIPPIRSTMRVRWHQLMCRNEVGRTFEERQSALYYKFAGESPEDLSASGDDSENLAGSIKWVAFKNQFFSSVLIARGKFNTADVSSAMIKDNPVELKNMDMDATFDYDSRAAEPASFMFYFGPNDYPLLSSLDDRLAGFTADGSADVDLRLNKLVPLGWGLFGWINRFVTIPVFTFLGRFLTNYGIIILILTLLVKLVLFPLTFKSYKSQAKMRVLAPEIKEINERFPGQENALKRQQETMALYSKAGASPFSGCLPMLLQMPVLIALFWFFPSAIELRGQSFLWAHDLSAPDFVFTLPFAIPFLGNKLSLFCLLMTVTNIIYTRINMQNQPSNASMPAMKWMMYLMPLMFLFFFNDYASGLSYYYFLSLLITIVQTYAFRYFVDEKKVRAQMMENAKKPRKKTGFMARLEAAQKRQEAMMREQARQNSRRR